MEFGAVWNEVIVILPVRSWSLWGGDESYSTWNGIRCTTTGSIYGVINLDVNRILGIYLSVSLRIAGSVALSAR